MSMNDMDKELNELKGFVADLKADRAAQKVKEQRALWCLGMLFAAAATVQMIMVWRN
jgi:hypothetical protein